VTFSAAAAGSLQFADAQVLLADADMVLFEVKHNGRNQIRWAKTSQEALT
jgi:PleD family two-component response regulator